MIGFREATASDRDAILELRRVAFPDDDQEKQRADFWQWEFVDGYAGPARIFVAESDDRIVGHFAFVPQTYAQGAATIRGALAVDVMTHPDFRRQKVFSRLATFAANAVRHDFQLILAFQIRDSVAGGMAAGGWAVAGAAPVLLRPFGVRRQSRRFESGGTATALLHQPRSEEFSNWRFQQNPHWHYTIDRNDDAFLIYRDTKLKGIRTMAIADCGGEPRALRELFRRRPVLLAAAMMTREHPAYPALRHAGFFPGPHRFNILLQVFDRSIQPGGWSLSWADTDHL